VVLSVMNLVILISSTACLYLSSIMINIYLLPYLELVNSHFATVSYLILAIGFFLLLFSFLGIGAALSNSRPALILYAVFMSIVVLMELASIFVSMELRQELERKIMFQTVPKEMSEEMSKYWYDEDVRYKWDTLQRDFQCCGALNLRTGFQDWDRIRHSNIANDYKQRGVPDSCCLMESVNCGAEDKDIFTDIHAYEKINIHGCLTIMKERLARDIAPLLLTYIGCGVVLCLISIISLVLASAFVAKISRKERHHSDGLGMYEPPKSGHGTGMNRYDETSINAEIIKTLDSGLGGGGSLRSVNTHGTQSPPRTPIIKQTGTGSHRASLYIEPTSESETVI